MPKILVIWKMSNARGKKSLEPKEVDVSKTQRPSFDHNDMLGKFDMISVFVHAMI